MTYSLSVTALNSQGKSSIKSVPVSILIPNTVPTTSLIATPSFGSDPLSVEFNGMCTDPDLAPSNALDTCRIYYGDETEEAFTTHSTHVYAEGSYSVRLVATDNKGLISESDVQITVSATQQPPESLIGVSGVSASSANSVTLTVSPECSADVASSVKECKLSKDSSPLGFTSGSQDVIFTDIGSYLLQAESTLVDETKQESQYTDGVSVIIFQVNSPPSALLNASAEGQNPTNSISGVAPFNVTFNATCDDLDKNDPDWGLTSCTLRFGDSTAPVSIPVDTVPVLYQKEHQYGVGTYTAMLNATDAYGESVYSSAIVNVTQNALPTASISITALKGVSPFEANFTVNCSDTDAQFSGGELMSCALDFGDGIKLTSLADSGAPTTVQHTYSLTSLTDSMAFTAYLNATDKKGASTIGQITLTAVSNQVPVTVLAADKLLGTLSLNVTFSGNCSDPDKTDNLGMINSCVLSFGDGTYSGEITPETTFFISHDYSVGEFKANLTAIDDKGAASSSGVVVDVLPPTLTATVLPELNVKGTMGRLYLNITSGRNIPAGSIINISLPLGLYVASSQLSSCGAGTSLEINPAADVFKIHIDAEQTAGTQIQCVFRESVNPSSGDLVGTFMINVIDSSGAIIDFGEASGYNLINSGTFGVNVAQTSYDIGAMTNATILFTPTNPIPLDGYIKIIVPESFDLSGATVSCPSLSTPPASVGINLENHTMKIRLSSLEPQYTEETCEIYNMRNPTLPGLVRYQVQTTDAPDPVIDQGNSQDIKIGGDTVMTIEFDNSCVDSGDCIDGICLANLTCGCDADSDCSSSLCNMVSQQCQNCASDQDCGSTFNCNDGKCENCTSSADCVSTGLCNSSSGKCIICQHDSECFGFLSLRYPCMENNLPFNQCNPCSSNNPCESGSGECMGPDEGGWAGQCVRCDTPSFNCSSNDLQCNAVTGICEPKPCQLGIPCTSPNDCCTSYCEKSNNKCAYCNGNDDCASQQKVCRTSQCVDCPPSSSYYNGDCIIDPDPNKCGDGACSAGETCYTCASDCGECPILDQFPIASIQVSPSSGNTPLSVSLTGSCSDPEGLLSSCNISYGDGISEAFAGSSTHEYNSSGMFIATLTAMDASNQTSQNSTQVVTHSIGDNNTPPYVSLSADPISGTISLTVSFTGYCVDTDGYVASCRLSYGDGTDENFIQSTQHTYGSSGRFNAILTAIDNESVQNQSIVSILASAPECGSDGNCGNCKRCYQGHCAQITSDTCNPPPQGTSGNRTAFVPEIITETEQKVTFSSLYALFGTAKMKTEAASKCIRGARCFTSSDCCGAECISSECACSMTACVTSGDCCDGYCYKGKCRLPPIASLFLMNSFGRNIDSQIGCAGLIEECSPSETNCISLCSGLSILLVLVSAGFGTYSWRRFGHPIAGLVAAFVPITLGMATYPFIGIIMSVVLVSLLVSRS